MTSDVKVEQVKKPVKVQDKVATIPAKVFWIVLVLVVLVAGAISFSKSTSQSDSARTKSITKQLRCLECEGLSIYDSDTKTSKTIAKDVARRVKDGQSNSEINSYYVGIYGEYILLAPTSKSGNWLIYVLPAFFVIVFLAAIFLSIQKKVKFKTLIMFWIACGLIFVSGIVVFVNDSKSTQTKSVASSEKSNEELLQQAVDESPNNGNFRSLAIVQFAKEDFVNALKNFDEAAKLNPNDAESRGYAAYIVSLTGDYDLALDRAQKAVAAKGDDVTALFFRGLIYYQKPGSETSTKQQNLDLANADFDKVIQLAPESEFASQIADLRAN